MEKIALLIFVLGVVLFTTSTTIIAYHFHNYRMKKNRYGFLIGVLAIGTCLLLFAEFATFFSIDWQELTIFMQDYTPTIPTINIKPGL